MKTNFCLITFKQTTPPSVHSEGDVINPFGRSKASAHIRPNYSPSAMMGVLATRRPRVNYPSCQVRLTEHLHGKESQHVSQRQVHNAVLHPIPSVQRRRRWGSEFVAHSRWRKCAGLLGKKVLRPFSDSIPANSKPAYVIDACNPVMCLKTSLYACIFTGITTLMLRVI